MIDLYGMAMPFIRMLEPERAHRLTICALRCGLVRGGQGRDDPALATQLWGKSFANPVGLAAGFDKHAEVVDAMLGLGFGFVEAGTVTPKPQPGNPKPRLFRLTEDEAVINRYGFNSEGIAAVRERLMARKQKCPGIVGINVGANKESGDPAADYAEGMRALGPYADYVMMNVSSPNTPGLRDLQRRERLTALISGVQAARATLKLPAATGGAPALPLVLKIAPDLSPAELDDIAAVALETAIDGVAVSNTTIARPPSLKSPHRAETGGLSGAPLFAPSTEVLRAMYRATGGKIPLIGVGGIRSGEDAYKKIRAGASLVQLYTALVYRGPGLVGRIKADLAALLRRDGFTRVAEAVGAGAK